MLVHFQAIQIRNNTYENRRLPLPTFQLLTFHNQDFSSSSESRFSRKQTYW
jgi:hypothetical protein